MVVSFSEISFVVASLAACAFVCAVFVSHKPWGRMPFLLVGASGTILVILSQTLVQGATFAAICLVTGFAVRGYAIAARLRDCGMSKLNAIWAFFPYLSLALLVPDPEQGASEPRVRRSEAREWFVCL